MEDGPISALGEALAGVVQGDLESLRAIRAADHESLRSAAAALSEPLVVAPAAVIAVLRGLADGVVSPEDAQAWASLVRRGFMVDSARLPLLSLDIEYDEAQEDAIVEAVARLDEIGDMVDGEVTGEEALSLMRLLGEP